jgi:glycosyltransferase involved in cell wall biosynthesis
MMRNTLWKLKRKSLIRAAVKSAKKDLRPMISFACERPAKIREISDYTTHLLETGKSLNDLQGSLFELASNSHTIPDVRNLLLGVARGCLKANENEHVLLLAKPMLSTLDLATDHRLLPALVRCSIESEDEALALQIIAVGLEEQYCRDVGIEIVSRIIQTDREQLENVEISHSVEIILGELGGEFEFSTEDYKFLFRHFKGTNQNLAIKFGLQIKEFTDPKFCRVLCRMLIEMGYNKQAIEISHFVNENCEDSWHINQSKLHAAGNRVPSELLSKIIPYPSEELLKDLDLFIKDSENDVSLIHYIFNLIFPLHKVSRWQQIPNRHQVSFTPQLMYCGTIISDSGINFADFSTKFADVLEYAGLLTDAKNILLRAENYGATGQQLVYLNSLLDLSKGNIPEPKYSNELDTPGYNPTLGEMVYLLHNSAPYNSGGYATRSHGLMSGIRVNSWCINAVTRLGFPVDTHERLIQSEIQLSETIEQIPYHRLLSKNEGRNDLPRGEYISRYAEELHKLCLQIRPSIIHAASFHMNGFAANMVARNLGIPSIYEIRGLSDITRQSRHPEWFGTESHQAEVDIEALAAINATAVITITDSLKEEMVNRGVDADKITVIHNGVNTELFKPHSPDNSLSKQLGIRNKVVIGYVGSIVDYEGLDVLLDAVGILEQRGIEDFIVLIVGDGACLDSLKTQIEQTKLRTKIIFTGRVPHDEVVSYYSLIDITPFPRKSLPVTEMVSPMKPFEAMAMEKLVICSDVSALTEIVNHEVTGLLFSKDNPESLADTLLLGINDSELRNRLGRQAREWVKKERDWKILSKKVTQLYDSLIETSNE